MDARRATRRSTHARLVTAILSLAACADAVAERLPSSADFPRCFEALRARGVEVKEQDSEISHPSHAPSVDCAVIDPVKIANPIGGVRFRYMGAPAPTSLYVTCRLALALSHWAPELAKRGVVEIEHKGTYKCRAIANTPEPSEHAKANAIDIAAFIFASGERFSVEQDWDRAPAAQWFDEVMTALDRARYFNVILTPAFDAQHRDHIHLDLSPDVHIFRARAVVDPRWLFAAAVLVLVAMALWLVRRRRSRYRPSP